MTKNHGKVYLGYEEDFISEKNQSLTNYTVNKIGGLPDWPPLENLHFQLKCPLCGLHRVLVVQCYAPLENSVYHRTLYVFACLSPHCWNQSESWLCLRSQIQDNATTQSTTVKLPSAESNTTWCNGADEWDESNNEDLANGNVMNVEVDNASSKNGIHRNLDEDKEIISCEVDTVGQTLGNLQVFDRHSTNMSPVQGAEGTICAPTAAAELEVVDAPGLVIVDTPSQPTNDVKALLFQSTELPSEVRARLVDGPLQFIPKYIYVEQEWRTQPASDDRITELLNKYKKENADMEESGERNAGAGAGGGDEEQYEEVAPLHGDALFHAFLTHLRSSPGQILRYSREVPPLLGAPLASAPHSPDQPFPPSVCARCGAGLICELQLVPEFAETLRLALTKASLSHLHFLSVLIFTCSQSCWQPSDTLVLETVIFQPEVI